MEERYVAFDVETPNAQNRRMSAIGVSVIERGEIVQELYTLVDPQTHFDPFNIALTGITPEQVRGQPDFPALWQLLEPMLAGRILVAHNAPFDLRVLASCLHDYRIDWKPEAAYLCTCQMGRKAYPYLPNHKLNTLCDHLRLDLDHHNAGSDSRACALLLLDYLQKGLRPEPFSAHLPLRGPENAPVLHGISARAHASPCHALHGRGRLFAVSAQRFEALYAAGHEPAGGKRVQDRHQGQDQAEEGCCRHQLRQQEEIERADRDHEAKAQQHTQQHACALLCRLRLVDPVEVAVAQILHQADVRRQQHEQQLTGQQQRRLGSRQPQSKRSGQRHKECGRNCQRVGQA